MKERIEEAFLQKFGAGPEVISHAPGRLEILGNHTDYNQGTVLSTAVDLYIYTAATAVEGELCSVWDDDFGEWRRFNLHDLGAHQAGDWGGYVKGMVLSLQKIGVKVPAFNAVIKGNVPLSAGMSSSAAIEMSVGLALCALAGSEPGWLAMAKAGQSCENEYIGAHTGLLDQFSSLRGAKNSLIYSDFRTLETSQVRMPAGFSFVVVNSQVKHVLTNEYNDRRLACQRALECIQKSEAGVAALRDVPMDMLLRHETAMDAVAFDCARHVVGEIERVARGIELLKNNDIVGFGGLMFASHESSKNYFRNSCDELDELVSMGWSNPLCLGARLSGGGFGGITVHLVRTSDASLYAEQIVSEYARRTGRKLPAIISTPADGAALF